MTRVYLAQHALAFDSDENEERPLTPEGEKEATNVANLLYEQIESPSTIYHSKKLRAAQTASIFSENLAPTANLVEIDGLQPMDDPKIIANRINNTEEVEMYVGHLPHMPKLAAQLINNNPDKKPINFHNGGIVCLVESDDGWQVDWYIKPDLVAKPESPSSMYQ